MKILQSPIILTRSPKQHNINEKNTTTTVTSNSIFNEFDYCNINFYGTKNLAPVQVTSEMSKKLLSKMQFLDKYIQDMSKLGPISIFKNEALVFFKGTKELENIEYFLTLDKTQKDKNIYIFTEHHTSPNRNYSSEKMKCVLNENGQMIDGHISQTEPFGYVLSFERNNKNIRRLVLGNYYGTTTYAPAKDSSQIWASISSRSNSMTRLSPGDIPGSIYKELFMELTKLNTSIKAADNM